MLHHFLFFVLLCGLKLCFADTLEYTFKESFYWNEEETFYTCEVKTLDNKDNSMFMSNFTKLTSKNVQDVKQLVISNTNTVYLPQGIGELFNLTSLMVYSTPLKEINGKIFVGMDDLKFLYLTQNQLSYLPKDTFATLRKLKKINLGLNQLEILENDLFTNNLQLDSIWLHKNKITAIGSDVFKHLIKLNFVDLRSNKCVNKMYSDVEEINELKIDNGSCKKPIEIIVNSELKFVNEKLDLKRKLAPDLESDDHSEENDEKGSELQNCQLKYDNEILRNNVTENNLKSEIEKLKTEQKLPAETHNVEKKELENTLHNCKDDKSEENNDKKLQTCELKYENEKFETNLAQEKFKSEKENLKDAQKLVVDKLNNEKTQLHNTINNFEAEILEKNGNLTKLNMEIIRLENDRKIEAEKLVEAKNQLKIEKLKYEKELLVKSNAEKGLKSEIKNLKTNKTLEFQNLKKTFDQNMKNQLEKTTNCEKQKSEQKKTSDKLETAKKNCEKQKSEQKTTADQNLKNQLEKTTNCENKKSEQKKIEEGLKSEIEKLKSDKILLKDTLTNCTTDNSGKIGIEEHNNKISELEVCILQNENSEQKKTADQNLKNQLENVRNNCENQDRLDLEVLQLTNDKIQLNDTLFECENDKFKQSDIVKDLNIKLSSHDLEIQKLQTNITQFEIFQKKQETDHQKCINEKNRLIKLKTNCFENGHKINVANCVEERKGLKNIITELEVNDKEQKLRIQELNNENIPLQKKIHDCENQERRNDISLKTLDSELFFLKRENFNIKGQNTELKKQINSLKNQNKIDLACQLPKTKPYNCNVKSLRVNNANSEINQVTGHAYLHTNSDVTKLSVDNSEMLYLPNNIFKTFQNLLIVTFQYINLKYLSYGDFSGASSLTTLVIYGNHIKFLEDYIFEGAEQLESIDLNFNKIEKVSANTFKSLWKLEKLSLMDNSIEELHVNLFKDLVKLKFLNLAYNELKYLDGKLLQFNTKLVEIFFDKNKLVEIDEDILNYSKYLRSVNFSGNVCINKSSSKQNLKSLIHEIGRICNREGKLIEDMIADCEARLFQCSAYQKCRYYS